jgi:hypothetical protein
VDRRRQPGRLPTAGAVLGVIAAALAGCGGGSSGHTAGGGTTDGPRLVAQAATRTTAARSARFDLSFVVHGGNLGDDGHVDATGTVDLARDRAAFVVDLSGITASPANYISARVLGTVTYLELPGLPSGKRWVRVDAPSDAGTASELSGNPIGDSLNDPTRMLERLRGVASSVQLVDHATLHGATTTHYRAMVPFTRFFGGANGSAGAGAPSASDLGKLASVQVPLEVWIDGQGRARRIRMSLNGAMFPGANATDWQVGFTFQMDLYDFGAKAEVGAPPAGETVAAADVPDVARAFGLDTASSDPTAEPAGSWTTVQHGATKAGAWAVGRAPAGQAGVVCIGFWFSGTATGEPADSDCLDVNGPEDPITLYGADRFGSDQYVYGGVATDADRVVVVTDSGDRVDAQVQGGTFVAFVSSWAHVDQIEAHSTENDSATCLNTDRLTPDEADKVDNPC